MPRWLTGANIPVEIDLGDSFTVGGVEQYAQQGNAEPRTVLSLGCAGEDVSKLQRMLIALGYSISNTDGIYGYETERAVKQFQQDHNLPETGIANKATLALIYAE